MASRSPIRGYVAKVLNSRALVINKGSKEGVELGMVFQVLDKNAESIVDPVTGDSLGGIDRPKIEVKVTDLYEKVAVAETFKSERVNVGGTGIDFNAAGSMFSPPRYIDQVETLKSADHPWEDLPEEKSIVKIGDPIKEISENIQI
jgi:hypothetical protein